MGQVFMSFNKFFNDLFLRLNSTLEIESFKFNCLYLWKLLLLWLILNSLFLNFSHKTLVFWFEFSKRFLWFFFSRFDLSKSLQESDTNCHNFTPSWFIRIKNVLELKIWISSFLKYLGEDFDLINKSKIIIILWVFFEYFEIVLIDAPINFKII